jgi:two-component system, LytTR family, response regulator
MAADSTTVSTVTQMTYPEAIAIRAGRRYAVLSLSAVDWIEANGNYVRVYVNGRPRIMAKTLARLEREVLDPQLFARVHRSVIVNMTKIASVQPYPHGDASLELICGAMVRCSRRYRSRLKGRIYFSS